MPITLAKKILEMEKDKLMSEPESERDWELITALDIAIDTLDKRIKMQETTKTFVQNYRNEFSNL